MRGKLLALNAKNTIIDSVSFTFIASHPPTPPAIYFFFSSCRAICVPQKSRRIHRNSHGYKYMRNTIFKRKTNGFFVIFARCFCRTNVLHIAFDHFSKLFFILFMQRYICAHTIIFILIHYSVFTFKTYKRNIRHFEKRKRWAKNCFGINVCLAIAYRWLCY